MTIVFVCLLVTVLTPRKKADLSQAPELETQVQEKVQDAVGKALVENKIEVQKNNTVSSSTVAVSAPAQKVSNIGLASLRRSSAKATLSAMYSALMSFHAEHGRYTTDLYAAGFSLNSSNIKPLKTGFIYEMNKNDQSDIGLKENTSRMNTDFFVSLAASDQKNPVAYTEEAEKINFKDFEKFCRNKCSADENSFEIISIIPFDDDHVDVWIMNERKEMIQVQDGLQGI